MASSWLPLADAEEGAVAERRTVSLPQGDRGRILGAAERRACQAETARALSVRAPPAFHGRAVAQRVNRSPARSRDRRDHLDSPQGPPESFHMTRGEMYRFESMIERYYSDHFANGFPWPWSFNKIPKIYFDSL